MADKKADAGVEKVYNIPLRKSFTPESRYQKTKKSVSTVKNYVRKHSRASEVKVSSKLNEMLWAGGATKPLKSVRVKVNLIEGIASIRLPEEMTLEEEKRLFKEKKDKKDKSSPEEKQEAQQKPGKESETAEGAEKKEEGKAGDKEEPKEKPAEEAAKEEPKTEEKN